ncbi:MAG: class I adenylate-forming enzyme family protein [Planctomycetaceae bacterium]
MQLESFLEHSAGRLPDKIALICGERRWTYSEIEAAANRLAHALLAEGVKRGDRVAIYLDNCYEAVVSIFGVLKAGAVFMPVNPSTKADKLAYLLNNSRGRVLIAPARQVANLETALGQTADLKTVIVVGNIADQGAAVPQRIIGWNELQQQFSDRSTIPEKESINIDLAALIYTSGSTGNAKGVMLTHLNMVSAATSITTYLENREDDIILNVLPISFDYGLYQLLMAFKIGGTLVLEKSFTYPHAVLQKVVAERVTGFPIVPTISAILLQLDLTKYDFSRLRYLTNTAAALPTEHIHQLRRQLPHVRLFSMYGLTECKRVSYLPVDQLDRRPGSVGIAIPFTEVYVVNDRGEKAAPNEVGELVVRGAHVMKGYWDDPVRTAERLKPGPLPCEMVLYTGDLFRQDEEGYLYFVGRKDDIIKSRGEKVSPREIENVLYAHPEIAEAAVIGVPDAILGQAIHAIVTLKKGATLTEKEALNYCKKYLEDFMIPQKVVFRDDLPKSPNGKIDKKQLAGATT